MAPPAPQQAETAQQILDFAQQTEWIERTRTAADIAERWICIWHVSMPIVVDNGTFHWKRGIPTTGQFNGVLRLMEFDETFCDELAHHLLRSQSTSD